MARDYFYPKEENLRNRLLMLRELLNEINLYEIPCPRLLGQLNEFGVIGAFLISEVEQLTKCVEKALE